MQAAQANLVTAAAQRVLQACKDAGQQPAKEASLSTFTPGTFSLLVISAAVFWTKTFF